MDELTIQLIIFSPSLILLGLYVLLMGNNHNAAVEAQSDNGQENDSPSTTEADQVSQIAGQ